MIPNKGAEYLERNKNHVSGDISGSIDLDRIKRGHGMLLRDRE